MNTKFVEISGCEIHYDLYSPSHSLAKKNLTLINGHTRTASDFKLLGRKLSEMGYLVIALDNRASGRSKYSENFPYEQFLKDTAAIWSAEKISHTAVLGISMGGAIAIGLSEKYPEIVDRAIITSSFCYQNPSLSPPIPWGDSIESVQAKLGLYFAPQFVQRNPLLLQSMSKAILNAIVSGSFSQNSKLQRAAMASLDLRNSLTKCKQPFLFIHGDQDQILGPEHSISMHEMLPQSELKLYEQVGHLVLAEAPERFYRDIQDFMR